MAVSTTNVSSHYLIRIVEYHTTYGMACIWINLETRVWRRNMLTQQFLAEVCLKKSRLHYWQTINAGGTPAEGILGCPVIKKTRPSHSDSLIQDISVAQAEASSNDELQHADYVVDATSLVCSSALRISVQRYTLLLNGWGENRTEAQKARGERLSLNVHLLINYFCMCTHKA